MLYELYFYQKMEWILFLNKHDGFGILENV